jgi:hypothetical protein
MAAAGLAAALWLAACGERGAPDLMNLRATEGPDEFAILPPRSLELPPSLTELPEPTPGGTNLTDPDPHGDAIDALGGRRDGGAGADGGLVAHVTRYGTDPAIRAELAAEDLEFRQDNRGKPLERLFNVNVYFKAYRDQSLDQHAELAHWRRRGVKTVSAPPEGIERE